MPADHGIPMRKLRLVVVGPGLIGNKHLQLIESCDQAEVHSIVAPSHPDNKEAAVTYGVPMYKSIEECLLTGDVDGVIISSPNEFHFSQALTCIEANVPVLIEKPITTDTTEAAKLVSLARKGVAKILVGHHRMHSPLLKTASQVIRSGRLGRIVTVIGSAQFFKPEQYFKDSPWRAQPGGGPLFINMIHEVGSLRALVGEITGVQAISSSRIRNLAVEDTVAINFMFDNGALGTFLLSDSAACPKSWEQTSQENARYPSYEDEDCYTVTGTRGTLSIPTMRMKTYSEHVESSWWLPFEQSTLPVARLDPLECQLQHFLRVIRGEEIPLVSALEGYKNLKIIEAIRDAIKTRTLIEIEVE
jgi:predicted dehydrogenase